MPRRAHTLLLPRQAERFDHLAQRETLGLLGKDTPVESATPPDLLVHRKTVLVKVLQLLLLMSHCSKSFYHSVYLPFD